MTLLTGWAFDLPGWAFDLPGWRESARWQRVEI